MLRAYQITVAVSVLMLGPLVAICYLLQAAGIENWAVRLLIATFLWSPVLLAAVLYLDEAPSPLMARLLRISRLSTANS